MSGIESDDSVRCVSAVSDSFAWRDYNGRSGLVCTALEPFAAHVFTTASWPIGMSGTGGRDAGWHDVSLALGVLATRLVFAKQVHGTALIVGTEAIAGPVRPEADLVLLRESDAAAAVQVADCVPMLVADRVSGAVAAVHAGWRGMAAHAPHLAIEALEKTFGARPTDLIVALGPSIGACCYEVGPDVRDAFIRAGFAPVDIRRWFHDRPLELQGNETLARVRQQARRADRWFFDGWTATREQIVNAGVPPSQVFSAATCTASHSGLWCSYRRDGASAGRIVGAIRCRTRP